MLILCVKLYVSAVGHGESRVRLSNKQTASMLSGFHSARRHQVGCRRTTGARIVCICPCVTQPHEQDCERLLYFLLKIISTLKYLSCRGLLDHHNVLYLAIKALLCMLSHGAFFPVCYRPTAVFYHFYPVLFIVHILPWALTF